jgi:hypothetical protein
MNRLLIAGVGAAVLAAAAGIVVLRSGGDSLPDHHVADLGPARHWDHIPLPITPPPDGAITEATRYADEDASVIQAIAFQYNGYTIDLCTLSTTGPDPTWCDPQPGMGPSVIRKFRNSHYITSISAYGKDPTTPTGATADAVWLFRNAPLEAQPTWLVEYAQRNNERITG